MLFSRAQIHGYHRAGVIRSVPNKCDEITRAPDLIDVSVGHFNYPVLPLSDINMNQVRTFHISISGN